MIRHVDLTWRGGEHRFLLEIDHLRAIQEKCDAGPYFVMKRLEMHQWRVDDVIQPIRFGLEGGGMDKEEARKLVRIHIEGEPLTDAVPVAHAILAAALLGVPDDPVGEAEGATESAPNETLSPEESGGSPISTDGEASSDATSDA